VKALRNKPAGTSSLPEDRLRDPDGDNLTIRERSGIASVDLAGDGPPGNKNWRATDAAVVADA
jgi:hypothetical protein